VFAQSTLDQVLLPAVRDGEVKVEFRHWTIVAPDSARAARGALAASVQGRHWSFLQLYYRNQPADGAAVEQPFLEAVATAAGVPDLDAWRASLGDPRWAQHLQESATLAQEEDFEGVPSFLVEGPGNSERFERPPTDAELGEALEAARPQSDG
jgi:2-hydroxychromene-2-carboxylate isomerase